MAYSFCTRDLKRQAVGFILVILVSLTPIVGWGLDVGDSLASMSFVDQHEKRHAIDARTRLLIFAPSRDMGELAHSVLSRIPPERMEREGIVYLADISAMPGLITTMFALPKFREYTYPVLLGYESAETMDLPRTEGRLTLIELRDGSVESIAMAENAEQLSQAISRLQAL